MKLRKLYPPFFWRYLAQRSFQRAHREAPLIVANAVPHRFDGGFTTVQVRQSEAHPGALVGWSGLQQ
jgi:hypothetical protein